MVRTEYLRFLQTLTDTDIDDDVRKIANLVLEHFDTLIPLSTSQGQRIRKVVQLASTNWAQFSTDIHPIPERSTEQACPITQLKSLSVGPFRGFSRQEDFDLDSRLVLIYGPNGTGKSSFCEALEFALLGSVAEAENKRFRDQVDYLKNAHTNRFEPPILMSKDSQGNEVPTVVNDALYRFCFVEKNRIDNFSRIAAQAPAKQTELISTLFGLDAFTDFVRNFTPEIDGKYIDLEGVKSKKLSQKRLALAGFRQQLETNIPDELKKLDEEEQKLAGQYREGCTYEQMRIELDGTGETPSLIQLLDDELQQPIAPKNNQTISVLQALKLSFETNLSEFNEKQQELAKAGQQISFKQLYDAVSQVQASSPETCPACQTPLTKVAVNPYIHAEAELKKLQHLSELQEAIDKLKGEIGKSLLGFSRIINICCDCFTQDNQLFAFQVSNAESVTIDWWESLHRRLEDGFTPWHHVECQVKQLESIDKKIDQAIQDRTKKQTEIKRLREFAEKIVEMRTRRETADEAIKKAKKAIEEFDNENAQLIADVEKEKAAVSQNQRIASGYAIFVQKLNSYKDDLPGQLIADLGEMVVTLYNAFNRNDVQHDQLAAVRLPLRQNERLKISFKNNPEVFFDALHILSEGHIRCMGLAILTAKNIKENCPLLIFDDPVNAIDDDHRESIRRTFFEDAFFDAKQVILACHGEEFFKDIQNLLTAAKASQSKTVSFLPKIGGSHIRVDLNCSPRNYILASRAHYEKNEIRDALGKSRQALESLSKGKVWRYVSRYGDGNLSIKLRSASAPIELRNLTEQLKTKILKAEFSDADKNSVLTPIESLLGINGDSREWRYLNKGTHEESDRTEFDRQTVDQIVTALELLDSAVG